MDVRMTLRATLMCGVATILATPVLAEDDDDLIYLDEIQVGQSKREIQTDTAESETIIGQEEMNDRQASTVAELIDTVPGVTLINGESPQGSGINIRGFGANSTYGNDQKVLIQIDGAPVGSEELYRIGTQLYTDPELFKQVTVLRGMGGSYEYGSGAVGGTVLLETKDASDFTGGEIGLRLRQTLQYSSNGDGFVSSTIAAWQPTENFEILGNYTWRDQGTMQDGDGNAIGNSAFTLPSWAIKARAYLDPDREHRLELSLSDTNSEARDVPYDSFQTTGGAFGNVDRDTHTQTAVLTYGYNPIDTDLVDFSLVYSYSNQEIDQTYVSGSSPLEITSSWSELEPLVNADHRYQTSTLTAKNAAYFTTGMISHNLRAGLQWSKSTRLDASEASAPGGTDERLAFFAVDEMDFGNGLVVTPGLRYEMQNIGNDSFSYDNNALMGGVSVFYGFGNGFAVFGSAGYTENLPIIDDILTPEYMTQSEKARTYELGVSYANVGVFSDADTIAVKATAYVTDLWDVTSYVHLVDGVFHPISNVNTKGLELEARYAMESGFYIDMNGNVQRGTFEAPSAPEGDQSGDWEEIPADQLRVTFGKRWGDMVDLSWEIVADAAMTRSSDPTPSNVVNNLRVTYKPQNGVLEGTEIRASVENLFDRTYTPHLATRTAPGRNFVLTLAKTF